MFLEAKRTTLPLSMQNHGTLKNSRIQIAVINDYKSAWAKALRGDRCGSNTPGTTRTLLQAGIRSAQRWLRRVLCLVNQAVSLDEDPFTSAVKFPGKCQRTNHRKTEKSQPAAPDVAHGRGLPSRFSGYEWSETVPTLVKSSMAKTANTAPIRGISCAGKQERTH